MNASITLDQRFCGPPDSGNGGYTSGLIAGHLAWPAVTVTLRTPPPLGRPLTITGGDTVEVRDGEVLVAEAVEGSVTAEVVPAVSLDEARAVGDSYPGFTKHPFPTCFTCGPERAEGDGLRIFPGRIPDGRTAAVWRVPAAVTAPMVWAALDCPGGWVNELEVTPRLLGRLTGQVRQMPQPGTDCLVMGRLDASEGRKAKVTTTLYDTAGTVLAQATAVWISIAR
ncbi:hypothetical protein [Phytomonospora endophytica]|uniref:Thioesterase domain-containing protein n=1 Tax=Phytomonospora endophytica TaxID=714109 RepID=A0A841FK53_9ACTN|nr:hypothetical protein [Phytomonospora endophytica]MBB6033019.1 hypothetical protein [Phytomonospora endophytica]GIG65245.1 hypothetical protein Pen01_15400 [Phytomonospora endophytica]